jgi:aspartyl-tRNA(Asn)/glutamyl-tRNA(Gln) amidotransferase subunit C
MKKRNISKDDVLYASYLSRIRINEERVEPLREQISDILGFIKNLEQVDTEGTVPTSHPLSSMKNVFREDVEKPSLTNCEALKNAPDKKNGFFRVPGIIQE